MGNGLPRFFLWRLALWLAVSSFALAQPAVNQAYQARADRAYEALRAKDL